MTDSLPNETKLCRHCGGTGRIPLATISAFPVDMKVWWNCSYSNGYGYPKGRIPAVVVAHSKSGKTARVRFSAMEWDGVGTYETVATVAPARLETRSE